MGLAATAPYVVEVIEPGEVVPIETVDADKEDLTDATGSAVLMVENGSTDLQR